MKIAGEYSFNNGQDTVNKRYPKLLAEIHEAISSVNAANCKTKASKEKTKVGRILYSPIALNRAFKTRLYAKNWRSVREKCNYPHAVLFAGL